MKISCFGEVLWDIFPKHKKIGGAPLNVALRLQAMGITSSIITKIGSDDLGNAIITYLETRGLPLETIQKDHRYNTGEVLVTLDDQGTASYEISRPVAWDFIELTKEAIREVTEADAIIYGSLASRNEVSRNTLFKLLDSAKFRILDVNLRPPHYNIQLLSEVMERSDFIKLNDDELEEICTHFKIKDRTLLEQIKSLASYTNTNKICVTKGKRGATLYYNDSFYHNSGYTIKVVDTVGAGDSFLAALISELLKSTAPQRAIDYACVIGAMVAGSEGANPTISDDEIHRFMNARGLI